MYPFKSAFSGRNLAVFHCDLAAAAASRARVGGVQDLCQSLWRAADPMAMGSARNLAFSPFPAKSNVYPPPLRMMLARDPTCMIHCIHCMIHCIHSVSASGPDTERVQSQIHIVVVVVVKKYKVK